MIKWHKGKKLKIYNTDTFEPDMLRPKDSLPKKPPKKEKIKPSHESDDPVLDLFSLV